MQQLVETHGVSAKLLEVVLLVAQTHSHGSHDLLGQLHDAVEVLHARLPEGLTQGLGPDIGSVGELLGLDLGVVHGQVARDVVALLQIGSGVGLDHLSVHDFVATVVSVLN